MDDPTILSDLRNYKGLKVVHLNVRSLVKKIDQIRLLVDGAGIDILTISETWLKSHLSSSLVTLQGFQTFRQDRNFKSKTKKRGGGGYCPMLIPNMPHPAK